MSSANNMTELLLVDDISTVRESFAELFSSIGYSVTEASSEKEALKILGRSDVKISFVLLDQVLDGTSDSGMKAAKKISEMRPEIFILMYTADPQIQNEQRWKAMASGAHRYIRKANAEELLRDINDFVQDIKDLKEVTKQFERIAAGTLEMASALVGMDIGITLIDKEFRVWYANKAQTDILNVSTIVGAPCWRYLHNHPVEHGPCASCSAKSFFEAKNPQIPQETQTMKYLSKFPSGKLGWLQVQTTPIFSESGRVIGARKATQIIPDSVVEQMEMEKRLRIIAKGVVFAGYGRARIYKVIGNNEQLQVVTAATGARRDDDVAYYKKIKDLRFNIQNSYIQKAIDEKKGTLHNDWDPVIGPDSDANMHLDMRPPWIDLPIWHEDCLIGWLGVDLVNTNRNSFSNQDVEALWPFAEEIRRAFVDKNDGLTRDNLELLNEIDRTRFALVDAQNADEALDIILGILSKIKPCSEGLCHDIQIRIRDHGNLVNLKHLKSNSDSKDDVISEADPDSLSAYVVRSGNAVYIDNIAEYHQRINKSERLPWDKFSPAKHSVAILPLQIELTCFGTLQIEPGNSVSWDEPGLKKLLTELVALTALIVRDIIINQKLAKAKALAEKEVELAFGAIHGIKGPVQSVRNYIQFIPDLQKKGKLTLEKAVECAESAGQALRRVERLADRLIRLVQQSSGQIIDEDTEGLFAECMRDNKVLYPDMSLEIEVSKDARIIQVERAEFISVLDELIANSARASNNKGHVVVTAHAEKDFVVITIKDNGPGVTPDKLERIFERWHSNFGGGTGLGLSYVRKVLEDMKGTAHAELDNPGLKVILRIPKIQQTNTQP